MKEDLLKTLNSNQIEAVLYNEGPSMVIAGAGSGKTRVLTYKIAYLLDMGLAPWNIMALTFTNKAAREMRERIAQLVGTNLSSRLVIGTFHSVFLRILRLEAHRLGYTSNFTIYDQSDSKSLIKRIIDEMQLDDKYYKPSVILGRISKSKNHLIMPESYIRDKNIAIADSALRIPYTGEIYKRYYQRCRMSDVMDFDDLLLNTYILFTQFPDILDMYVQRFQYILVDEYQDTNYVQHKIIWELTKKTQKLCVVGDDAQSIYSFRGAEIDNILGFAKSYKNVKVFKLERNYRSTKAIVAAANSLISHNNKQIKKEVYSENEIGEPIRVMETYSDIEEAELVASKIKEIHKRESFNYSSFAILYRTNAQSRSFEEAFRKRNMPYKILGGLSFYQRKEIKDVIAYCRVAVNPNDEEAIKRIINYPTRGIGQTTQNKIFDAANNANISVWQLLQDPSKYGLSLNKGILAKLDTFVTLINSFINKALTVDAASIIINIINDTGIKNEFNQDKNPETLMKQENIQELINGVQEFVAIRREEDGDGAICLARYLQDVSLISDTEEYNNDESDNITMMTIHSAKGLEFPVVFIVGMEDNIFPGISADSPRNLEEERRLFYVAITRAEKRCIISYAKSRYRYGKMEFSRPSRFIKEIQVANDISFYDKKESSECSSEIDNSSKFSNSDINVGQIIEHERFGVGEIECISGSGENAKATVRFRTGIKQLLLKFARFKILK